MNSIQWGVLSTANIGVAKVIPATQRSQFGEVTAIASRDGGRAESVAAELGIPGAFGSYEALLASPAVDAVYIPLPNHLHAEWAIKAAEAGKHVLCEKPLAMDAAEARTTVDRCTDAGVLLAEAFMYRFHPQWRRTRELVSGGAIGELRAVQAWFSYFNDDPTNIRNFTEYGGGALMDIGCYPISVSRFLFDAEPDHVESVIRRDPRYGTDVLTSALLRFGDAHATFTVSTQSAPYQRVLVVGTTGRIEVEIPFNAPNDGPTRIFVTTDGPTQTETFTAVDQYTLQADAFARSILTGQPPAYPPEDAVANMAVIDAVTAAVG